MDEVVAVDGWVEAFATDELVAAVGRVETVDGLDGPMCGGGEGDEWVLCVDDFVDLGFWRRAFKCALNSFSMML